MAFDAASAAAMITAEVEKVHRQSPAAAAAAAEAAIAPGNFCSIWPSAKPILQTLAGLVILIPGLGSTAGAVLNGLIKVGDAIYAAQC